MMGLASSVGDTRAAADDGAAISHHDVLRRSAGLPGVEGGTAPRKPLPGTREAWPQRVGWLPYATLTRRPTLGNVDRQNLHTSYIQQPAFFRKIQEWPTRYADELHGASDIGLRTVAEWGPGTKSLSKRRRLGSVVPSSVNQLRSLASLARREGPEGHVSPSTKTGPIRMMELTRRARMHGASWRELALVSRHQSSTTRGAS